MKKFLLAIMAICLIAVVPMQAQIRFGLKGGANVPSFHGENANEVINNLKHDIEHATNYHVGALVQIGLGKFFTLQPELQFSTKGATLQKEPVVDVNVPGFNVPTVPTDITLNTSYLELPINLQAGIRLGKLARVYLQAGPYASLLLAEEASGSGLGDLFTGVGNEISEDPMEFASKLDYGVGVGAGVEVLFVQLAVKYDFSFAEFKEFSGNVGNINIANPFAGLQNRNLNISAAFLF